MFNIKMLNNISDSIYGDLPTAEFNVSQELGDFDAVLVRSADMHEMNFPKKLVAIARAGAGVNNIPVESCSEKGIVVFNTPGANANAVKELVLCGMLLAGRKIVPGIEWLQQQGTDGTANIEKLVEKAKNQFVGPEINGKKLGVIGLGAIGVMVANAASLGFGMEVVGYDPYMSVEAAWQLTRAIKHAVSIDEIITECDYITLHLPLNEKTSGSIGREQLAKMKDGAVLLNFARGGLVDDDAVLEALESGKLYRYVTDFPNDKLINRTGVIATPHLGASTPESEENCAVMAAQQLAAYLRDGNIKNSVNFPDCELPRMGGYRLAIVNKNITNMVGQITSVLAAESHNIEHMLNKSRGSYAYTLIDLASEPTGACIEKIKAINGVLRIRIV
ncbi:MAG: phosphoglycerate dehydrogenase [Oscillospiraceae bacterium]